MYTANGLHFENKEDYVWGTADIEWEMYRNGVSDGCYESMPSKESFIDTVYSIMMTGMSEGVWSRIDCNGTSGSAKVPKEIIDLGEAKLKSIIGEYWESQDDKPIEPVAPRFAVRIINKMVNHIVEVNTPEEVEELKRNATIFCPEGDCKIIVYELKEAY